MRNFFFNLASVIRAVNPSVYAFIETTLPYSTPFPIASITMASAGTYFGLVGLGAFLFVYSLEGIGLISTSKLIEKFMEFVRSRNPKTFITVLVLAVVVTVYIIILVDLNVTIHNEIDDPNYSRALTLICFLPLIAGIMNGLSLINISGQQEQEEVKAFERKKYEDRREDKKTLWGMKYGQPQGQPQTDKNGKREYMPGDYKDFVMEFITKRGGNVELTEITQEVNRVKRVKIVHSKAKGTWHKYLSEWRRLHK